MVSCCCCFFGAQETTEMSNSSTHPLNYDPPCESRGWPLAGFPIWTAQACHINLFLWHFSKAPHNGIRITPCFQSAYVMTTALLCRMQARHFQGSVQAFVGNASLCQHWLSWRKWRSSFSCPRLILPTNMKKPDTETKWRNIRRASIRVP